MYKNNMATMDSHTSGSAKGREEKDRQFKVSKLKALGFSALTALGLASCSDLTKITELPNGESRLEIQMKDASKWFRFTQEFGFVDGTTKPLRSHKIDLLLPNGETCDVYLSQDYYKDSEPSENLKVNTFSQSKWEMDGILKILGGARAPDSKSLIKVYENYSSGGEGGASSTDSKSGDKLTPQSWNTDIRPPSAEVSVKVTKKPANETNNSTPYLSCEITKMKVNIGALTAGENTNSVNVFNLKRIRGVTVFLEDRTNYFVAHPDGYNAAQNKGEENGEVPEIK